VGSTAKAEQKAKKQKKRGSKKKYQHLYEQEDVRRWYNNVCRGSKITADVYFRRLGHITTTWNVSAQELAETAAKDEKQTYNFLLDIVTEMECQNYAGSYIASLIKAIKSWLSHNGIELKRRIKIKGIDDTPTLRDKQTLTQDRARTLYLNSPPQARCAESLMAQSGLRPEVMGYYTGSDGLTIRDIPEMNITMENGNSDTTITFVKIPCMLVVRKELSKAGHQYFTFMTTETCEYLKEYLYLRIKSGEVLKPDSPLIVPERSNKPFLTSSNVGKIIRTYMRKVGINSRPYDLRHTFDTQLMLAESRGLILRDYRTFFMGHKGDIENRYTTNKHSLPETVIEDMRKAFARSASFLQSNCSLGADGLLNLRDESYKRMLLLAGFTEEEVDKENILQLSDEEIAKKAREKLLQSVNQEIAVSNSGQKVIPLDELPEYLSKGWKCDHIIESRQQVIVSCGGCPQAGLQ
jgi:integrase